jgi:NADPH:quinone reductase and related Zn-dependent oxidoreductases
MKALLCTAYGPIDTLRLQDAPDPVPAAGEVVVAVRACALNFPDALIVQGLTKPSLPCLFHPAPSSLESSSRWAQA